MGSPSFAKSAFDLVMWQYSSYHLIQRQIDII
jgi:hypothetical protein